LDLLEHRFLSFKFDIGIGDFLDFGGETLSA
jgi:hypothetical protein